jgi:O-acetyl-ADP-ribose deacetylase (regulator of RNase III)
MICGRSVVVIQIFNGDLLNSNEKYIAHQANCVSNSWSGVAKAIFEKYTYSNVYKNRKHHDVPGTNKIMGDGVSDRFVINMFSQYYPGVANNSKFDCVSARQTYFHSCLRQIAKIKDLNSVAFPFMIGCGLAGGDWNWYLGELNNFADFVENKQGAKVFLYKL